MNDPFCDYCTCDNCAFGIAEYFTLYHAKTEERKWICDICYMEEREFKRAPKLITTWTDVNGKEPPPKPT